MIKFSALIHKETGTVIKYEDWKESAERDNYIPIKGVEVFINPKNIVKAREMLFSDDFEIIYDSEFTTEELELANVSVFECVRREIIWDNTGNNLSKKIEDIIEKIYENKSKYGIEV